MQSKFRERFLKDIAKIKDKPTIKGIETAIANVETVDSYTEINHIKKMKGHKTAYRIKINDYRMGIFIENNIVEFTRFLHRKDIYKFFP